MVSLVHNWDAWFHSSHPSKELPRSPLPRSKLPMNLYIGLGCGNPQRVAPSLLRRKESTPCGTLDPHVRKRELYHVGGRRTR